MSVVISCCTSDFGKFCVWVEIIISLLLYLLLRETTSYVLKKDNIFTMNELFKLQNKIL